MSVWSTLSEIDCNDKVQKKGRMTYLSWAWAWAKVMEHYPQAVFEVGDTVFFNDGSCEVWCSVTIEDITRTMWLPVMDNRNNAVANPDSRKISDTRMRCLVKCLALFGLGHYIYAGEDVPDIDGAKLPGPLLVLDQVAKEWVEVCKKDPHQLNRITDENYRNFIASHIL